MDELHNNQADPFGNLSDIRGSAHPAGDMDNDLK